MHKFDSCYLLMKNLITRVGSKVILIDSNGELWLTKRKKTRHDSRRKKGKGARVIFIPIKKL